jgi:hypothetical protein
MGLIDWTNADQVREYNKKKNKEYRAQNVTSIREGKKKWNAANREKINKSDRERWKKRELAEIERRNITRSQWKQDNYERTLELGRNGYKRRRAFLDALKLEAGCIDCGYNEYPCALDFDHRDPSDKTFNVGHGFGYNLDFLLEEIAKCDVRCSNCHRVKTWKNNPRKRDADGG